MSHKAVLKKPPQGSLRPGHPWIYRNQIKEVAGSPSPGDMVDVATESGRHMGRGYWNPSSEISVRLLTRKDEALDKGLFTRRIQKALRRREETVTDTNAYRLISSEADDMPGLIVDRYGEVLVLQILTLGMEKLKPMILSVLQDVVPNRGIFERSDAATRKQEGLSEATGWLTKSCGDEVVVHERDIEFAVRFGEGHKTGLYLDQRENRLLLRDWMQRGEALDVFCYEGAFGLHLAKKGLRVVGIDSQKDALERAAGHRRKNGIPEDRLSFLEENAFDALKALDKKQAKFDLVILDPPSFVKQKASLQGALTGYKEILIRSMRLLSEDGKLAVFSCAYHLDDHWLMRVCLTAAMDAKRSLRVLRFLKQSGDHPINPFIPETYYLKGFLFEVSS